MTDPKDILRQMIEPGNVGVEIGDMPPVCRYCVRSKSLSEHIYDNATRLFHRTDCLYIQALKALGEDESDALPPAPWTHHIFADYCEIRDASGLTILKSPHLEPEHAHLIVKAVNCHDELVEALEQILYMRVPDGEFDVAMHQMNVTMADIAAKALNKAKEQP